MASFLWRGGDHQAWARVATESFWIPVHIERNVTDVTLTRNDYEEGALLEVTLKRHLSGVEYGELLKRLEALQKEKPSDAQK